MKKLLTILFILLFTGTAFPATYYVDLDCPSTGGDGTTTQCDGGADDSFNTFAKALRSSGTVNPGDTVYVAGTGTTNIDVGTSDSGTSGNQITYVVEPGQTWTLQGPDTGSKSGIVFNDSASYITFDGIKIVEWYMGVRFYNSTPPEEVNGVIFQNCEVYSNFGYGGFVAGATGNIGSLTIDGCSIHDNGDSSSEHNIYFRTCTNCTIINNEIYNGATNNVDLYPDSGLTVGGLVAGNKIWGGGVISLADNGTRGNGIWLSSINGVNHMSDIVVKNNIIWDNTGSGIEVRNNNSATIEVYNNTTYNNDEYGVAVLSSSNSANIRVKNNIAWSNNLGEISTQGNNIKATNLNTNPLFLSVNPASSDFLKIGPTSNAYNAGSTINSVTRDYWKNVRLPAEYDIGAHEYGSSGGGNGDTLAPAPPINLQLVTN